LRPIGEAAAFAEAVAEKSAALVRSRTRYAVGRTVADSATAAQAAAVVRGSARSALRHARRRSTPLAMVERLSIAMENVRLAVGAGRQWRVDTPGHEEG